MAKKQATEAKPLIENPSEDVEKVTEKDENQPEQQQPGASDQDVEQQQPGAGSDQAPEGNDPNDTKGDETDLEGQNDDDLEEFEKPGFIPKPITDEQLVGEGVDLGKAIVKTLDQILKAVAELEGRANKHGRNVPPLCSVLKSNLEIARVRITSFDPQLSQYDQD